MEKIPNVPTSVSRIYLFKVIRWQFIQSYVIELLLKPVGIMCQKKYRRNMLAEGAYLCTSLAWRVILSVYVSDIVVDYRVKRLRFNRYHQG